MNLIEEIKFLIIFMGWMILIVPIRFIKEWTEDLIDYLRGEEYYK